MSIDPDNMDVRIVVLQSQFTNLERAIASQATEYERRLTELNHSHQRTAEDNARFLTVEVFDARINAIQSGIDQRFNAVVADQRESQKWHVAMDVWKSRQAGVILGAAAVAGLISGAISMLAAFWEIGK